MKVTKSLLSIALMGIVLSCSNEEIPSKGMADDANEKFSLIIKFEGKTYNVPCALQGDSVVYLDEDFNTLYKSEISRIPNLAALTYQDDNGIDVVEYYRSQKELEKAKHISYFNEKETNFAISSRADQTMPEPTAGRAILYDDTNYKDRAIKLNVDLDRYPSISNLKDYDNFNDKTSAIRVFNFLNPSKNYKPSYFDIMDEGTPGSQLRTCLISYEDINFQGKVLYCVADYTDGQDLSKPETASHQDGRLKNIGWNDKISSVVFRIITISDINSGDITPHD